MPSMTGTGVLHDVKYLPTIVNMALARLEACKNTIVEIMTTVWIGMHMNLSPDLKLKRLDTLFAADVAG